MDRITESSVGVQLREHCRGLKLDTQEKAILVEKMRDELVSQLPDLEEGVVLLDYSPFTWKHIDWNHNGFLQADELNAMVSELRWDRMALTDNEASGTHPSMREWILLHAEVFSDTLQQS